MWYNKEGGGFWRQKVIFRMAAPREKHVCFGFGFHARVPMSPPIDVREKFEAK